MSWIRKHPLLACALLALFLRVGVAVLTEFKPIFPAYYYTDADLMDQAGWGVARAWRSHEPPPWPGSPSQRIHAFALAVLYTGAGHRPIAAKLLMALAGAAVVILLYRLCEPVFGPAPALASALLLALWPSDIFFTSQNFKEGPVIGLCYAALDGMLRAVSRSSSRPSFGLVISSLALFLLGFQRQFLMMAVAAVLAVWLAGLAVRNLRLGALGPCLLAALLGPLLFFPVSRAIFRGPLGLRAVNITDPAAKLLVLPAAYDESSGSYVRPFTPRGLSEYRRIQQLLDQQWAGKNRERQIGTQLFFGLQLNTWWDVLIFLPKGMFYVLFMPLPGLYSLGHNLGRILASVENLLLLGLALLAAAGAIRGPKSPERALLLLFFFAMAAGSALLEFDFGGSVRHRLLYMPLLFPFALSLGVARRQARKGRLKVIEVLECGGPGGTGNQVAALCNSLDTDRFEVGLVYASRGSDPEKYRRAAAGAVKAFHLPEMVREISPGKDIQALIKLYRLFQDEAPDIVHAHSSKAGFLARLAAWWSGVPRIFYSPHGYGFLQEDRSGIARAIYKVLEWSVSWIGEIVAVSPSEAELARPLAWGKPVHVVTDPYLGEIPNGNALAAHPGIVVGSCARLTAARNPEAFVSLAQRLTDSRNNLRCLWIGGGEEEEAVRRHLENMNLLGKVEVTGWLESREAREKMRGLDLFVHYSRWDALPNAVLEAMAVGLPVVASDIPGNRDAVLHGRTGFLAKNEVELLEYCLNLVDDPELRRRLGEAGRERVLKEFGFKAALSRLEGLYSPPAEA